MGIPSMGIHVVIAYSGHRAATVSSIMTIIITPPKSAMMATRMTMMIVVMIVSSTDAVMVTSTLHGSPMENQVQTSRNAKLAIGSTLMAAPTSANSRSAAMASLVWTEARAKNVMIITL